MFALDRVWDTPGWPARRPLRRRRAWLARSCRSPCTAGSGGNRRLEQLARLLSRKHPQHRRPAARHHRAGPQRLRAGPLARPVRGGRSQQVADDAGKRDFTRRGAEPAASRLGLAGRRPGGGGARPVRPLPGRGDERLGPAPRPVATDRPATRSPRSTPLPDRLVVAHGEPFTADGEARRRGPPGARPGAKPGSAAKRPSPPRSATAATRSTCRRRSPPARSTSASATGSSAVRVEPTLRPELTSVVADVACPSTSAAPSRSRKDVRGGAVSLVKGSRATFAATASREPGRRAGRRPGRTPSGRDRRQPADGRRRPSQAGIPLAGPVRPGGQGAVHALDHRPGRRAADRSRARTCRRKGRARHRAARLQGHGPRRLRRQARRHGVARRRRTRSSRHPADGRADPGRRRPRQGDARAGRHVLRQVAGHRAAADRRAPVRRGLPPRPRRGSIRRPTPSTCSNAEQHAIWLTEQLSKWHRQSLEVRDREMQLYETNKQLRDLSADELDQPETRRQIESQAAAERANGRRLSSLVGSGEDLVKQAMRNPEIGVGHLEKWAEMLQILKDISANRMPSVADLLKEAAQAPSLAANATGNKAPMAGQVRAAGPGSPPSAPKTNAAPPAVPAGRRHRIVAATAREEGRRPPAPTAGNSTPRLDAAADDRDGQGAAKPTPPPAARGGEGRRGRRQASTTCWPSSRRSPTSSTACWPTSKAARWSSGSRRPRGCSTGSPAGSATTSATRSACPTSRIADAAAKELGRRWPTRRPRAARTSRYIMDDMQAYFERRRFVQFKTVLDEMRKQDVIGSLRQLGDDLPKEQRPVDRPVRVLVRHARPLGRGPGRPGLRRHLPRLQVEGQPAAVDRAGSAADSRSRDQPARGDPRRRAGQARPGAGRIRRRRPASCPGRRTSLHGRVAKVTGQIRELPDARGGVRQGDRPARRRSASVMDEATGILARPETGPPAIAAETEAIELLAQVEADQPQGRRRRRLEPGRRRDAARRRTRPWRCWAPASTRRKSAKTAASRRRPANRARRCPRSSAPASTSTSTGSNAPRPGDDRENQIWGLGSTSRGSRVVTQPASQ